MFSKNQLFVAIICALIASFIWASSFIALKYALTSMKPMSIIFLRMLIACVVFGFFYRYIKPKNITKKDLLYMLFMGICEPGLYFVFEVKALELTSASQAGVITATMPLVTAIGAWIFLKEGVSKQVLVGLVIAILGAVWLSLGASVKEYASNPLLGNTYEMLAMICGGGYAISLKYLSQKFTAVFLTFFQAFVGMIFFLPLSIYEYVNVGFYMDMEGFLSVLYLGVVVTIGGYGLFNYALSLAPASKVSSFINLIPVFTVILAYIFLGEKLTFVEILASLVVFLGVFISQKIKIKKLPKKMI